MRKKAKPLYYIKIPALLVIGLFKPTFIIRDADLSW